MKKQGWLLAILLLFVFIMAVPMNTDAAWKRKNGGTYYYDKQNKMVTGWKRIGKHVHYFNKQGRMVTGWRKIKGNTYYFAKKSGRMQVGWRTLKEKQYYFSPTNGRVEGKAEIDEKMYIFDKDGVLQKRWIEYNGQSYYGLKATGELFTGVRSIAKKRYFFNELGELQRNTIVTFKGQSYRANNKGVLQVQEVAIGEVSDDFIFFTLYESGNEGYAQTGGDRGNACGKYQFDNRYSLLPLVKYCYRNDPVVFKRFKKYARYTKGTKLKSNQAFFKAWRATYKEHPVTFKNYQDKFAIESYYQPTERALKGMGIDISKRPDAVKGAIFSYSIQHGSYTAALQIKGAKVTNSMSDRRLIQAIYKQRISKYSAYRSRYTREMNDALSRLK